MKLEEAIKQCEKFIKSFKKDDTKSVIGFDVQAIETVLKALKKLQKHCKEMIKEKQELTSDLLDSIPNKKIEDRIKRLEEVQKEFPSNAGIRVQIITLKELLEEN